MVVRLIFILFFLLSPWLSFSQNYLFRYSENMMFTDTVCSSVHSRNILYGYKDLFGNVVIPAKYHIAYTDTLKYYALVSNGVKYFAVDINDNFLYNVPPNPKEGIDWFACNRFRMYISNKMGFVNISTGEITIPMDYEYVTPFFKNIAYFCIDCSFIVDLCNQKKQITVLKNEKTKWGIIDTNGVIIIRPKYQDFVVPFNTRYNGVAKVKLDDNEFYINLNDEILNDTSVELNLSK